MIRTGVVSDSSGVLDFEEIIRQYILSDLSIKLLCRPDCPSMEEMN
ncbi:MAG: hypothetical protein J7J88_01055 [Dehalococcoidia bacterium]|nr:hypothetical protein [Dehalococcoidia bacterium]